MKALLLAFLHSLANGLDTGIPDNLDSCPPALACVALAVYTEARGEPLFGQAAVAAVIHKRMMDSGTSPCDVISAPFQFDGITRYIIGSNPWNKDPIGWSRAMLVSEAVFNHGMIIEGCEDASYFYTEAGRPEWAKSKIEVCHIGNHIFAK